MRSNLKLVDDEPKDGDERVGKPRDVAYDLMSMAISRLDSAAMFHVRGDYANVVLEARMIIDLSTLAVNLDSEQLNGNHITDCRPPNAMSREEVYDAIGGTRQPLADYVPGTMSPARYWTERDAVMSMRRANELMGAFLRTKFPDLEAQRLSVLRSQARSMSIRKNIEAETTKEPGM